MLSYLLAGAAVGPVVSQSLLDFMIMLIFVCFAVDFARNKSETRIPARKPFLFEYGFIFYILAILVGFVILNITDKEAWFRLYKFHWIINFYLFIWAFSRYELDLSKITKFFAIAYLLPNLYSIICTMTGYDPIHGRALANTRLLGLLESATYHAHGNGLILIFFLVILFFQFNKLSRFFKILSIFALLTMAFGIFLTFTRGIWLSLSVTTLIFLFFHSKKFFATALISGVLLFSGLYSFSEAFRDRIKHSIETKNADQERWGLLNVHLQMISESPIVGIGYSNSLSHTPAEVWKKYGYDKVYINSHAHNQLLNVLATTGILGFIPFFIFYFWFFATNIRLVNKYKREKSHSYYFLAIACLMTQVEFILANFTDVGFEYTKIRSLVLLVWALVFCMWQNKLKIQTTQNDQ